jgi:hypothetical protein
MARAKKKLKEPAFHPIDSFQLAECVAFGISLIKFQAEDGDFAYRAMMDLELETSQAHMLTLMLDIYDTDPMDAAKSAVICGFKMCPGHFDKISVFDEEGNVLQTLPMTISEILDELESEEDGYISPEDISTDRILH